MKGFLDTTILSDAVLSHKEVRLKTLRAVKGCVVAQYPSYAVKELTVGPLSGYRMLHNYLAEEESYLRALDRLIALNSTLQRNRARTALQALRRAEEDIIRTKPAITDRQRGEELRIQLKIVILRAYQKLASLPALEVCKLSCYMQPVIRELASGSIAPWPTECDTSVCAVATELNKRRSEVATLVNVVAQQEKKPENERRLRALQKLLAEGLVDKHECRSLGDAVFAVLAPGGFCVMTTNLKDHEPLAAALGKTAVRPY